MAVAEADIRKLIHDPVELFTRMVQPVLWLLIFGQVFNRTRAIPDRRDQLSGFHGARNSGAERSVRRDFLRHLSDLGARPGHRAEISGEPGAAQHAGAGQSHFLDGAQPVPDGVSCICLSYLLHVQLRFGVFALAGVVLAVMLGSAIFSTFSLIVACLVKSRERFMGIGQVLTMPLFFASNAIYPLSLMPSWLRAVSSVNPLSYQVDALRTLMIVGSSEHLRPGQGFPDAVGRRLPCWWPWPRSSIRRLLLELCSTGALACAVLKS